MAQTGYTPILIYSSSTAAAAPVAGNLTNSTLGSELAINITDGKLFYKDNANAVQVIAWKTTPTTAGGTGLTSYTAGDLPYYATGTTLSKLAIGSNGQILTSTGTAPQWTTLSGVAVTTFSAGTTGFTPNSATSGAVTLAGTLITTNGGTGLSSYTAGDLTYYASGTALTKLAIGAAGTWLGSSGSAPQWNTPAALTKTDDTNVTLTLGGNPSTALLNATSLTLGWTGTLATSRGGTGLSSFTANGVLYASSTSALTTGSGLLFDGTNLGIAITPSAWGGNFAGTQYKGGFIASQSTSYLYSGQNCFFNGTDWKYITANQGTIFEQAFGAYTFYCLPTGTAGGTVASFPVGLKVHNSTGVSVGDSTDPGAGNLRLTGNLVVATSGKGIDFSATPGTGTSELFADYEEGTFTPTIVYSGTNTPTYGGGGQLGRYTKIGRIVEIQIYLNWNENGSTGNVTVGALPFTSVTSNARAVPSILSFGLTGLPTNISVTGFVNSNATTILLCLNDNAATVLTATYTDNDQDMYLTVTYEAV